LYQYYIIYVTMPKINMCGINDINDPFYRYQMEKLSVKQQRTKTIITNFKDVAKDIDRDPFMLVDFFKKKFEANIIYKNDILSTTRKTSYKEFEEALREFIEFLILCPVCYLPETDLDCVNGKAYLFCKCCPFSGAIRDNKTINNKTINRYIDNFEKKHSKRKKNN